MKSPCSLQRSSQCALLAAKQAIYVAAMLLVGLPGCKKENNEPAHKPKPTTPASSQTNDKSPEVPAAVATPTAVKPQSNAVPAEPPTPDPSVPAPSKRDAEGENSVTSPPAESAKSASSGLPPKRSPQAALAAAKKSRQSATEYARQGKLEPAFKEAVKGWQMVRTQQSDPNCKALTASLLDDIKKYSDRLAKAAGGKAGMPDASKPIRFE